MADMIVDSVKLDACLDAEADAIRAKTGGSADIPFDYANNKGFADAIAAIPSGGGTPQNGIVFNALNNQGKATEATFYGDVVPTGMFGRQTNTANTWAFPALTKVHLSDSVTKIADNVFRYSLIEEITGCANVANLNPYGINASFANASALKTIALPKVVSINNSSFATCTALETVTIGSIGYGVSYVNVGSFSNCTQSGLTITIYTTGSFADTAVANTRNGATNATIIIKASEATTYGGNSYAAGDTILTSTP